MKRFDLIVIGSGSGLDVANAAAEHGLRVAIVEKDRMGGTCLNRGCIPSKLLLHSADVAETIRSAGLFGIDVGGYAVDFARITDRATRHVDGESSRIREAFDGIDNPKLFAVQCRFTGRNTIQVGEEMISADRILIACGARPSVPDIPGLAGSGFITSDGALRLREQPRVLTILGGGYIACEMAHFFGALGTSINIVQRRDVLLPNEDEEVSRRMTEVLSRRYGVYTGFQATRVLKEGSKFHVLAGSAGRSVDLESDHLLVATGRTPNTDTLDLEKTGVKTDSRGRIMTDAFLETSASGIFALGDAVGRYQFKHSANHEAQYAFANMIHGGKKIPVDYFAMPHGVFCWPQVAGVGMTEQEAHKGGLEYIKSVYPYSGTAMGEAIEDRDGFVKFLVDKKTRKILGCHMVGAEASILIHEVLVAMRAGDGTIDGLARTIFIHPSLSEVVARAAYAVG